MAQALPPPSGYPVGVVISGYGATTVYVRTPVEAYALAQYLSWKYKATAKPEAWKGGYWVRLPRTVRWPNFKDEEIRHFMVSKKIPVAVSIGLPGAVLVAVLASFYMRVPQRTYGAVKRRL